MKGGDKMSYTIDEIINPKPKNPYEEIIVKEERVKVAVIGSLYVSDYDSKNPNDVKLVHSIDKGKRLNDSDIKTLVSIFGKSVKIMTVVVSLLDCGITKNIVDSGIKPCSCKK
ncbi:hypothetical protein mgb1_001 [Bacillus phage MG-B1]|uniref:Uncharacterized protein n=1 Tax=Bacillus phage MG-B1 TaxID=1309583 RepID=M4W6L2_9CAUD|nr:hypothetical protein mgb1_001 [Bacillus phage MG-B1]AGI10590.1 hypothetical protein mgb1_001 [Bacillus phage MG-B1]